MAQQHHPGIDIERMLDGSGLAPEDAAEIGYVDEVVAPDELVDRAVAAVKRSVYLGGSLGLKDDLHLENAEFLSTLASPGAHEAMLAYLRRTEETGDLPRYDQPTYDRTLEAGSFGRVTEA